METAHNNQSDFNTGIKLTIKFSLNYIDLGAEIILGRLI
jgi:hypothetical protein